MAYSNENKRKLVSIDMTEGKQGFDTSKIEDWSQEEWEAFKMIIILKSPY